MSQLKKHLKNFLKNHDFLRNLAWKTHAELKRMKYQKMAAGESIDHKLVIFETFMGRQYGCNPKAMYEYMLTDSRFNDYRFVWVLNDENKADDLPGRDRVEIVEANSDRHYKLLAQAGYVVTNSKLDFGVKKKDGQVFLQTWHGTPLKKLRCDIVAEKGNAMNSLKEIREKNDADIVRFDYFISPSKFCSDKFTSAFNLKKLGLENILVETGYPRNDLLFNYDEEYAQGIREKLNIKEGKKVILYAPTFRDNQHDGAGYTYDLHMDFDALRESLQEEYVILFRAHYFVASQFDFAKYEGFIYDVSQLDDITPLYTIADILVTDYSSVFFDYANLKRPMVFYMYDLEEYADNIRGFYMDIDELPGLIVKDEVSLIEEIKRINDGGFTYDKKYEAFNNKYNYLDDGNASKRAVEILFKMKEEKSCETSL